MWFEIYQTTPLLLFVAYIYPSGDHSSFPSIRFSTVEKRNFVYGQTEGPKLSAYPLNVSPESQSDVKVMIFLLCTSQNLELELRSSGSS